jgi:hypothetical protein
LALHGVSFAPVVSPALGRANLEHDDPSPGKAGSPLAGAPYNTLFLHYLLKNYRNMQVGILHALALAMISP